MIQDCVAFCGTGSRRIPDHTTRRICADPNGGEVAAIMGDVVMALPAVAHVARVSREQDRRFELAGMHVVMVTAADTSSSARFRPVSAAWVQPDSHRAVCIRLLHHIAEHKVAAVTVHRDYAEVCVKPRICGDGLRWRGVLADFSA